METRSLSIDLVLLALFYNIFAFEVDGPQLSSLDQSYFLILLTVFHLLLLVLGHICLDQLLDLFYL